ncbi:hypothetical protein E6H34_09345 [Candidatus Bathyarchaeota archaeon]|nr:MAG: hypothetical protein E6H34_09345 [Candidatus Bathyarchaeota archaeon]
MRRLLIKLVAIETMLVGWLSYWIFLVYANNPSVSAGLGDQLTKFPQLAFTTVDIAVLVIIAAFAITLAFKFHRGLRPGIRLERALQMLENLMKRNLVLEAQVAELRVDKIPSLRAASASSVSVPGLPSPSFAAAMSSPPGEPNPGSWEKAFRTPLEAGPPTPKIRGRNIFEAPFQGETGIPPPRIEAKPPMPPSPSPPLVISERPSISSPDADSKFSEKPMVVASSSGWEDSPKYVGESTGVLNPTGLRKTARIVPDQGLKQPYIPVPVPRAPPPSVIVGPMGQKPASPGRQTPRPIVRPTFPSKPPIKEQALGVSDQKQATAPIIIDKPEVPAVNLKSSDTTTPLVSPIDETKEKPVDKPAEGYKKKSPREED